MEDESINKIIDPAAFDQLGKLEDQLDILIKKFIEAATKAQTFGDSLAKSNFGNYSKISTDSADALDKVAKAQANVEKQEVALRTARQKAFDDFEKKVQRQIALDDKRAARSVKNTEKQRLAELKLDADRKKNMDKYEATMARKAAADEKAAAKIQENSRAYVLLSNQLEESRKKAQDFAIIFGENSEEFTKQAKLVTELDTRLKAIDESLGKYGRNVGNYKSAWNGLGNSINQITRELPAFTVSAQTGFLAISNNLPTLFDEIEKVSAKLKETSLENAVASGEQAAATALAGGASEEAASQIGDLAKEQALSAAEGQHGVGILKALGGAIFSWSTLLSVGVTLLTVYGKNLVEFVSELFNAKQAQDELAFSRKMLNDVNLQGAKDAQKEIIELKTLYDTAKNVTLSSQQRYDAAKKLQEQYPKTFENYSVEQIELGKVDKAYVKLTESILATARARASQDKIAENSSRILDDEQKMIDLQAERIDKQKELGDLSRSSGRYSPGGSTGGVAAALSETVSLRDIDKEINALASDRYILNQRNLLLTRNIVDQQKKGADLADYTAPDGKKSAVDTSTQDGNKAMLEAVKSTAKELIDNENETFAIRLQALQSYQSASEGLVKNNADKEIEQAKGHKGKIEAIRAQEAADYEKVTIDTEKIRKDITDAANKATLTAFYESEQKEIQAIADSNNAKLELIEKYRAQAVQGTAEQYAAGIISKKQYEDTIYEIEKQAALDRLGIQIDGTQKIIDIQREDLKQQIGTQKELSDSEKKASDLRIQYSKLATDAKIRDKERELAKEKEVRDKAIELGQEVFNFTKTLTDGIFTRRQNKIQEEIDANQKKAALDIENVNDSVLTEEEKADKIAIINAKADAQQTLLEQKQRQQRIQQAKFDKAAAAASVIANTAVAIMKTYASGAGFFSAPLAILQGAIGAVQLAAVLATPIPKYWNGTPEGGHPEDGWAMVGDGYKHELIIDPRGNMSISPNRPTYTMLEKGTEVIGGDKFERMINYPSEFINQSSTYFDDTGIREDLNKVEKAIKSMSGAKHPVIIDNGISKAKKWASSKDLNNYNYRKA